MSSRAAGNIVKWRVGISHSVLWFLHTSTDERPPLAFDVDSDSDVGDEVNWFCALWCVNALVEQVSILLPTHVMFLPNTDCGCHLIPSLDRLPWFFSGFASPLA